LDRKREGEKEKGRERLQERVDDEKGVEKRES